MTMMSGLNAISIRMSLAESLGTQRRYEKMT